MSFVIIPVKSHHHRQSHYKLAVKILSQSFFNCLLTCCEENTKIIMPVKPEQQIDIPKDLG